MTKFKLSSINSLFLIFLVAPYYLNDLVYFFIQHYGTLFFLFDYLIRTLSLVFIFSVFGIQRIRNLFLKPDSNDVLWLVLLVLVGFINDFVLFEPLNDLFKPNLLFAYPAYPNLNWRIFDLSIGLLLVALSEELIFRFYLLEWLEEKSLGLCSSAVISSIIFAGIHWG